jgi:hypothetical protein
MIELGRSMVDAGIIDFRVFHLLERHFRLVQKPLLTPDPELEVLIVAGKPPALKPLFYVLR